MGNNLLQIIKDRSSKGRLERKEKGESVGKESHGPLWQQDAGNQLKMESESRECSDWENPKDAGSQGIIGRQSLGGNGGLLGNPSFCRICMEDFASIDDPIVSPCLCTGSISGVHYKCLRKWLDMKTTVKKRCKAHVSTWDLSKFKCEVCHSNIPGTFHLLIESHVDCLNLTDSLKINGKNFSLLPKPKNSTEFIQMLVSLGSSSQQSNRRQLIAIEVSAKQRFEIVFQFILGSQPAFN